MKFARPLLFGLLGAAFAAFLLGVLLLSPFNPLKTSSSTSTPPSGSSVRPVRTEVATNPTSQETSVAEEATAEPTGTPEPTDEPEIPPPTPPANSSEAFQQGLTLRRDGDYPSAATAFRTALGEDPDPALAHEAQFRLGESLYLAGDFTNAVPALQAVIDQKADDNLAARAHYFLGDIFTQRQAYADALTHLRAYRQKSRALTGIIDEEIAGVLSANGDTAGALAQYNTALQDGTLTPARRVEIYTKIADLLSGTGKPAAAVDELAKAFAIAPDNTTRADVEYRWGAALQAAGNETGAITHWKHDLASYSDQEGAYQAVLKLIDVGAPNIDDLQRGIADYYHGAYDQAITAFRRYLAANNSTNAEPLYFAALSYLANGSPSGAMRNYDAIINGHPKDKRVPDAYYGKAVAQGRAGNLDAALAAYRQFATAYPNDARADDGLWQAANLLDGAQRFADAAKVYEELAAKFPASIWAPTALFNAGVDHYLVQDVTHAKASWNAAIKNYPAAPSADSSAYWLGKVAQAAGDKTAPQLFQQAAKPPRTYYSWRAIDALGQKPPPPSYDPADYTMGADPNEVAAFEEWLAGWNGGGAVSRDLPSAVLSDPNFRRGSEFASLDRALEARQQFAIVNDRFKSDARALYALARYYQDNNYFSTSIDAATRIQTLSGQSDSAIPRYLRELIYPTYFADLVVPYAKRHGLDPALFFGLIRQESGFNPMSNSSASARGLTQVIPGTGDLIARALGVKDFQQSDLFKPYVSVRFGTYYLGTVLQQFSGNIFYGLMAYNGGPGNAAKWQKPDIDVAVESVTYSESNLYVRTVYAQYRQYVDIYRETDK